MQITKPSITIIAASIACLFAATPLHAAEEPAPGYAETTLSGDWGGSRSRLAKDGLVFEGLLRFDQQRNRGAVSNGTRGISHVDLKLKADLDAAWGWKGTSAMINVLSNSGVGANARHVSGLMGTDNIEVGFPTTTRLFQAWVQQNFLDERLAVLAGLYPIDSEFFGMDSAAVLVSPQYGTPADLAQARGGAVSVFNNAAFGIRTKLQTMDKSIYAMWALMDGIPNDPARPKRTAIRFAKGDGAFNIAEIGWLPEAANDKFEGHAKYAAGIWGYTAKVADLVTAEQRHSRGGYLLGEHTLVRLGGDNGRYISGFARATWTDGDSTAIKTTSNVGLHVKGPVASRPDDIIGLAWSRAKTSAKWRTSQLPTLTTNSEDALEVTYRYAVTPYFSLQPNYQRIVNPGGVSGLPAARLIGARIELVL